MVRAVVLAVAPLAALQAADWPYRRLFLDGLVIERQAGLERVFHSCEKHPANPVLVADTPWETPGSGPYLYGTVMREGGKLRMWYHFLAPGYANAYAESVDGIRWTKPSLGIIGFRGSKANNMFVTVTQDPDEKPPRKERGQCHNPSVLPGPGGEDRKYVLFCYGADYDRVRAAFSADGLRWTFVPETAKQGLFESSDVVNFFYDPYQHRYVSTWKGSTRRGRSVGVATSEDALHWEKPASVPIFAADDLDPPDTQIYGMPVFPYEGMYIGVPWIYHARVHYPGEMLMTRAEAEARSSCLVDTQLAWSWDLVNWTRPPERAPFIARGAKGQWDSDMIYTAQAPVLMGDKLYFYYGGFDTPHNARKFHAAIGVATLRLDGFCSMRAGRERGWLVTRRENMTEPRLTINAVTRGAGALRAEILDDDGKVIPGFSAAECEPFRGDSVRHALKWKAAEFPADRREAVKKIRFEMVEADLYSYAPR
ncbi:MAG: hypothetical protein ACE15B_10605 [Bryobacteraceae bacterium]